jgi:hypothetical protein
VKGNGENSILFEGVRLMSVEFRPELK